MLQVEDVVKLISSALKKKPDLSKLDMSAVYVESVRLFDKVKIHADITEIPRSILLKKFPNESEEEYRYRVDNYEPVTPSYWNKAIGVVNRVWNRQNYSIVYRDKEEGKYFTENYPVYGNIEIFFKSIVTNQKINDPNSVLAIKPMAIPTYEKDGEIKVDQTKEIDPYCYIYGSKDVIFYEEKQCLVVSEEKTYITSLRSKTKEKIGIEFNLYDENNIYRIYQVGKKEDYIFEWDLYYEHNLGYLPVWKLKGFPVYFNNNLLYHSYFIGALPLLNKAVALDTTLDVALAKHTYPIRSYYYEPCNAQGCDAGKVRYYEGDEEMYRECQICKGTGELYRFSPHKDYKMRIPDQKFEGDQQITAPGVFHIDPPTNNMEFTKETIYEYINAAFSFLNIDVSNSDVKGSETALGKKIDREELMSFLLLFSYEIFTLLYESIYTISFMRYGVEVDSSVTPPSEFSIKNASDLTKEYIESKELPSFVQKQIMNEFLAQRFGKGSFDIRLNNIVNLADPYITFSNNDIIARKGAGVIDTWEIILHDSISVFLEEKMKENEKFFDRTDLEIVTELQEMAKEKANSLNTNQNASTQNILSKIGK